MREMVGAVVRAYFNFRAVLGTQDLPASCHLRQKGSGHAGKDDASRKCLASKTTIGRVIALPTH